MILWADDDSEGLLAQLPFLFQRKGSSLVATASYEAALGKLESEYRSGKSAFKGLLVDVILPRKNHQGTLARDLGVLLARRAVREFGISRVCFLTVVRKSQMRARMMQVGEEVRPPPLVDHYDKAIMLERDWVSGVLRFFGGEAQQNGAQ